MKLKNIVLEPLNSQEPQLPYWLVELIEKERFEVKYNLFTEEYRYLVYENKTLKGVK
jgi:hypothetical protein